MHIKIKRNLTIQHTQMLKKKTETVYDIFSKLIKNNEAKLILTSTPSKDLISTSLTTFETSEEN